MKWLSAISGLAEPVALLLMALALLLVLYVGIAVCVATLHPKPSRRRDARLVLKEIVALVRSIASAGRDK